MLVKQIGDNSLNNEKWRYHKSKVYAVNDNEVEIFNKEFEKMEKEINSHQKEFYILSNSRITG